MKYDTGFRPERPERETEQSKAEGRECPEKKPERLKEDLQAFFHDCSQRHYSQKAERAHPAARQAFLAEVRQLDASTPDDPEKTELTVEESPVVSPEELAQLEENDPGYVNGRVLDYDNDLESDRNRYAQTGLHTGAIRWGEYAEKGSVEQVTARPGEIYTRWGSDTGSFLAPADADYKGLALPVIEEKQQRHFYQVLRPFPVERSRVAPQPWNDARQLAEKAVQLKAELSIRELVRMGYLSEIPAPENKSGRDPR